MPIAATSSRHRRWHGLVDRRLRAVGTFGLTVTSAVNATAARTALGLAIGTDVQAYDADLATIAALTATTDSFMQAKSRARGQRARSRRSWPISKAMA
jgi:ABC-type sulfate transport system permease component